MSQALFKLFPERSGRVRSLRSSSFSSKVQAGWNLECSPSLFKPRYVIIKPLGRTTVTGFVSLGFFSSQVVPCLISWSAALDIVPEQLIVLEDAYKMKIGDVDARLQGHHVPDGMADIQ
ncbi:hypothetical protein SCAR479_07518 [Seiridium cardinale]|uniref:Uncharacterized protein n=1 Tax=Seiridium cardinale TaxID=138064 RepID=A0ABR2XPW3_9PEZI